MGLYRWSKNCYFEFFIVLLNPFWYYCTLFPCYSTVEPYYCPLLPCYSTLRPYYLPFLPCYSTLSACYSTVKSNYSTLIMLISLLPHGCWQLQTQIYSRLDLKCSVLDILQARQYHLIYTVSKYFLVFEVMHTLMHRWIILRYQFLFSQFMLAFIVYVICWGYIGNLH